MTTARRIFLKMNGFLKSYGPSKVKSALWDKEYSTEKWNFAYHTEGDCLYSHLERHAANGSILDLGCGMGNTANEVAASAYQTYVGVDISETCLQKATMRSEKNGRADRNRFALGDLLSYVPEQQFNVILFRESMYHVPLGKIKSMLDRYSHYLREGGVFIVRMNTTDGIVGKTKARPTAMVAVIESNFNILEKRQYSGGVGPTVIVFRPT